MQIVFLGGLFPEHAFEHYLSRTASNFQAAANALQWDLVRGFDAINPTPTKIVTLPFVGDYPTSYADPIVLGGSFSHHKDVGDLSVGFINVKGINQFSKYHQCLRTLNSLLDSTAVKSDVVVVVYGLFAYLLLAAAAVKRRFPEIRICQIVPDLPEMMGGDPSRFLVRVFNSLNRFALKRGLKSADSFVLLSKYMCERLPVDGRPWVVMEGIAGPRAMAKMAPSGETFIICYTGTLAKRYGIKDLLDAFMAIDGSNYELWLCGTGDGRDEVLAAVDADCRIKYFGQLDQVAARSLQERSSLLVNPRTSDGDYTKYSFPSKTLEYFSSGVPCVMHRLSGVPDEYYSYCLVPKSEDSDGLRRAIMDALEMGQAELRKFGLRARNFVLLEKNREKQCRKIVEMLRVNFLPESEDEKNSGY